jgi:hypothetical protein
MFFRSSLRIAVILLPAILLSCGTPEYLSEPELLAFCQDEDHGLTKTIVSGDVSTRLTYRPTDVMVSQEMKTSADPSSDKIATLREKYSPYYYFILSLSRSGKEVLNSSGGHTEFSSLLQTISFRMGEVVNLTTPSRDTIPLTDFVYNRTFGLSASTDILLVFPRSDVKDETIQINIDEFGLGAGKQSLIFKTEDLNTVPRIFRVSDESDK